MSLEETAVEVGLGAAAGLATGLTNVSAPQVHHLLIGDAFNKTANATNVATKSFQQHHKIGTALAAGTTAVLGHGVIGAAVVAVAPVAAVAAVVGGAAFGIFKLVEHLRKA